MTRILLAGLLTSWALASCTCPGPGKQDAGPDGGAAGEGEGEGGEGEGGGEGEPPLDGGPNCTASTPGFGDPCAGQDQENPPCGTFICNAQQDTLVCNDPGDNACGICGDLDESAGRVGQPCGVAGCGIGVCNSDGTASECQGGDILRNECGGCATLLPLGAHPGDVCSSCDTGTRTCTTDLDSLVCFRGQEPDNQCGQCGRCVLFHAFMADHIAGGGYLNPGTTALIEDIGGGATLKLDFDPLVQGPGACCLPFGTVFLAGQADLNGFAIPLTPQFSSTLTPVTLADPVRYYDVPSTVNFSQIHFILLGDQSGLFQDPVLSVGELVAGPPPETDAGPADAGTSDAGTDAGPADAG